MTARVAEWTKEEADKVQACLAGMLASGIFAQAERQKRLLSYLVTQTLAGRADLLKGYTIGTEVFDRGPDFDPAIDAIVRVEAARLRAKLREYYDGAGAADPVRIEIPKGSYSVRIEIGEPSTAAVGGRAPHARRDKETALAGRDKPSLAVLPFANMSNDPEQDYFADGITEDLTTELSKLSGLLVISRHSAFAYRGVAKRAEDIAQELGVRYLVEGSVQRAGDRVRIGAQLVDSTSGAHVWAERYDRELKDIFALQDDVTRRIVDTLNVKLTGIESERLGHEGTSSLEAHDMLLRGLESFWLYSRESAPDAERSFRKATELDPDYAAAHTWLARAYCFQWAMNWTGDDALEQAYEHAKTAVGLDDRLPYGHAVLGWVQTWRKQGDEALAAGRRAVALDPNNADAHLFLSITLSSLGRGKESLNYIRSAIRLNPHPSAFYLLGLGMSYYVLGQYEEAIAAFRRGTELAEYFPPNHVFLATTYAMLGRKEEAAAARDKVLALTGGLTPPTAGIWIDEKLRTQEQRNLKLAGLA